MTISRFVLLAAACCAATAAAARSSSSAAVPASAAPQLGSVAAVSPETDPGLPGYRLLRFSGAVALADTRTNSGSRPGSLTLRFALFAEQQGGEPMWAEEQRVEVSRDGSYSALLGSATQGGLPAEVFANGNARWLAVSAADGEETAPRLLLVGVPYAMEAQNAQTLGGLPASAFVLVSDLKKTASAAAAQALTQAAANPFALTGTGKKNWLAKFTSPSAIGDSEIFDSGSAVGIGTAKPVAMLDVAGTGQFRGALALPAQGTATTTAGTSSWPLNLTGSVYSSTSSAAVSETFQWQVEPFLNNTAAAQNFLALNYIQGSNAPVPILLINNVGRMSFPYGSGYSFIPGLSVPNTFIGTQTFDNTGAAIDAKSTGKGSSAINATDTGKGGTAITANGDGYGVFANGTGTNGVGLFGSGNWGVQAAGKAYGVYATSNQPSSVGVFGQSTGSSLTAGVWGEGAFGVFGLGTANGVFGRSNTAGGTGVQGIGPAYGLYGTASATTNSAGVYGTGPVYGVWGNGSSGASTGVYGTGSSYGVYGANSSGGVGVYGKGATGVEGDGTSFGVLGSSSDTGVRGISPSTGVEGIASGTGTNAAGLLGEGPTGVWGIGNNYGAYSSSSGRAGTYGVFGARSHTGSASLFTICYHDCGQSFTSNLDTQVKAGVWADTNWNGDATKSQNGGLGNYIPALLVTADATAGAIMLNDSANVPTLVLANNGAGGSGPDVLRAEGRGGRCTMSATGDVSCTGGLKTLAKAKTDAGEREIETYAVHSAENWLEDAGTAQLVNGHARVTLEPIFGQTVNTGIEYHVFLTPDGDCKGLYLSARDANGFEVRELGGGTASIAFEYRIMAKRVGHEADRLVDVEARRDRQREEDAAAKADE